MLLLVMVGAVAGMVTSSAGMYAWWRVVGSPGRGDLQALAMAGKAIGAGNGATGVEPADPAAAGAASGAERAVVASAPIEADENVYQRSMARRDVLVMVEYYADW